MNETNIFYMSRDNQVKIIAAETIPNIDGIHPLLKLAIAISKAGYAGIAIDEQRLSNGKYFQAYEFDKESREGKLMQKLQADFEGGKPLPSEKELLAKLMLSD